MKLVIVFGFLFLGLSVSSDELLWPFTISDVYNNSGEVWHFTKSPKILSNLKENVTEEEEEEGERLPECANVTLRLSEYEIRKGHMGPVYVPMWDLSFASFVRRGTRVVVCFGFLDAFRVCYDEGQVQRTSPGSYVVLRDKSAFLNETEETFKIGDYFLAEDEQLVTCSIPQCSNLTLDAEEYVFRENNGEVFVPMWNRTFPKSRHYVTEGTSVIVCYPFTLDFKNCAVTERLWGLNPEEYSLETNRTLVHNSLGSQSKTRYFVGNYYLEDESGVAFVCADDGTEDGTCPDYSDYQLQLIALLVSCASLVVVVVFRLCTTNRKQNFQKASVCYLCCLLIAYLSKYVALLERQTAESVECFALAFLQQFFVLATFFWLNVVAYAIYFGASTLPNSGMAGRSTSVTTFLKYSAYGWFPAFLIATGTLAADFTLNETSSFKPRMETCWINNMIALSVFLYLPIGLTQVISIVFYSRTVRALSVLAYHAREINPKAPAQVASRLFKYIIFVGLIWVIEMISFYLIIWLRLCRTSLGMVILDILLSLQGFFILVIGIWDRYAEIGRAMKRFRDWTLESIRGKFFSDTYTLSMNNLSSSSSRRTSEF